ELAYAYDRDAARPAGEGERDRAGLLRGGTETGRPRRPLPWLPGARLLVAASDQGAGRCGPMGDRPRPARLWRLVATRAGDGLRHGASDGRSGESARPPGRGDRDLLRPRLGRDRGLADAAHAPRP